MATDPIKALTVSYRSGERIVTAGEQGVCLFVVQSGAVRLTRPIADGPALEIAVLEKGEFFGESSVLEGRPYGVTAEAIADCEVLELGALTFEKMLRAHPEIAVRLLRQLSGRVDRLEQRLSAPGPAPAPAFDPAATPVDGIAVAAAPAEPEAASEPAPPAEPAPPPRQPRPSRLLQEDGSVAFSLSGTEMLLGRYDPVTETQPEIDLGPLDTKRSVSRRHARLSCKDGTWHLIEESGALNGTFVNGIKLLQGRAAPLADGDTLSLGMVRLVFREA